jgi:hypothetical protein
MAGGLDQLQQDLLPLVVELRRKKADPRARRSSINVNSDQPT